MRVVLVSRQGCHLCDQARDALVRLGVEAEVVDVDADRDLLELYDWRVPVILVDGEVVAEGKVDPGRLEAALSHRG